MRLNKYIANSGYCSRRAADELITQNRVKINDKRASQGMQVGENDIVYIDNKPISKEEVKLIYLVLHKPIQVVSTVKDPEGRTTVLDLLPTKYKNSRLYPVGRLDYFSEGLIFLTNDGELAHKFMHPKHNLARVYRVRVRKENSADIHSILNYMKKGMTLEDGTKLTPVHSEIFNERKGKNVEYDIEFTLYQGVNRQIRRMCQETGLTILRLMRISHGSLELGNLNKGECRELSTDEAKKIKEELK